MAFTLVDIIILVVVLASALMALMRGLTRELLTIIAWVAAAVFAIYVFPFVRGGARQFLNPPMVADIVSGGVLFLIVLIPALVAAAKISLRFGRDDPGVLDRTGGFIFGIVRGLFIVGLVYWANVRVLEAGSVPSWIENARLRPLVTAVAGIFPQGETNTARSDKDSKKSDKPSSSSSNDTESGYGQTDRSNLDELITTTSED